MKRLSLLFLLMLTACASGPTKIGGGAGITKVSATELPGPMGQVGDAQGFVYTIQPYDRLIVDVLAFPDLSDRKLNVDATGNITLPIAGEIAVKGLTPAEAAEQITVQMRRGYVREPQVSVNIDEANSQYLTVEGEVEKPGNFPLVQGMTLLRALAAAQGTTELSARRSVVVHRRVNGQKMVALYDLEAVRRGAYPDPALYPQDIVVVGDSANRRLLQVFLQLTPLLVSPLVAILDGN